MYANIAWDASFWQGLGHVDQDLQARVVAERCPHCGGPLHVANYPRKPRGLPDALAQTMTVRLSTCCGHCRKRCTPPSVRFLGRRVYVGVVVMLAVMVGLACEATRWTLRRWRTWWTKMLPRSAWWTELRGRLAGGVDGKQLPAVLLQRCEPETGKESQQGLLKVLKLLLPLTSHTSPSVIFEG